MEWPIASSIVSRIAARKVWSTLALCLAIAVPAAAGATTAVASGTCLLSPVPAAGGGVEHPTGINSTPQWQPRSAASRRPPASDLRPLRVAARQASEAAWFRPAAGEATPGAPGAASRTYALVLSSLGMLGLIALHRLMRSAA